MQPARRQHAFLANKPLLVREVHRLSGKLWDSRFMHTFTHIQSFAGYLSMEIGNRKRQLVCSNVHLTS